MNQREQISATVARVVRETRISNIRIMDHEGVVKHTANDRERNERLDITSRSCAVCHTDPDRETSSILGRLGVRIDVGAEAIHSVTPVLAEPGCLVEGCHEMRTVSDVLGVIDVELPLEQHERALEQNRFLMGGLSVIAVCAGSGLVGLALTRRLRRPMDDLISGIRHVAEGHLSYRIPVRRKDEMGEIAVALNEMSRRLDMLQKGLIQSERLISMGKLAAGVAHEINNPLTGILSYAEDLVEETDPADPRRKDCEVIQHEALRCRRIVRDLLDFARQETPSPRRTHPRELVAKALDMVARQAAFQNIRFTQDIQDDLPLIEVDPVQIQQVLVNLIINAQQAMKKGGVLVVGARRNGDEGRVEFLVQDEGTGIPSEIRSRIFEPFYSTKGGETDGLGLAVSLGIVQQHGGSIEVESELGKGTAFRIVLPVERGNQSEEQGEL